MFTFFIFLIVFLAGFSLGIIYQESQTVYPSPDFKMGETIVELKITQNDNYISIVGK